MTSLGVSGSASGPRFLVVGAGGIGGVVAAQLLEQGHDVTTLTTNPLIADAINAHGFRVRGESAPGTVRGRAVQALPKGTAPFDYVLLATQPPQLEEAARSVEAVLAPDGHAVIFQNGLCEERVEPILGTERVIGAVVAWGASMIEPGVYDRTSAGGFQIGRLDGSEDEALTRLARALEAVGPTTITRRLRGARWSKLAINCAISSLGTVGGDRLGVLMRHRYVRRLALEIMTETVEVARALGVELEKVSGTLDLDWRWARVIAGYARRCCRPSSGGASRASTSSMARSRAEARRSASRRRSMRRSVTRSGRSRAERPGPRRPSCAPSSIARVHW